VQYVLEAVMVASDLRALERTGGFTLVLLGVIWLVMGLRSIGADGLYGRGALVVALISAVLVLSGALLAKPRASTSGRVLAIIVCLLGAFRELMLLDHQDELSLQEGGWIGLSLLALYAAIGIVAAASLIVARRSTPS
jgi:hypothetical protein